MTGDIDKRGRLESDPFDASVTASGAVLISRGGRLVTTVRGKAAERLAIALDRAGDDDRATQLLLAKATGHYKH
ncbi:MAG: hypothetical protein ABIQ01_01770 [Pseudolysinimonas sp.]